MAQRPISHRLSTETRYPGSEPGRLEIPALTILAHQDPARIGELATLPQLGSGEAVALSRLEPLFATPGMAGTRRQLRNVARRLAILSRDASGTPVESAIEPLLTQTPAARSPDAEPAGSREPEATDPRRPIRAPRQHRLPAVGSRGSSCA